MASRASCACGWTKTYPSAAQAAHHARRHVCARSDGVRRTTRRHRCARCGLVAVYENAGAVEARNWFRKHSCQKHEQASLRAALHADRMALIDRTPKPCLHKVANHQHGTYACYVLDKCRCEPCAEVRAEHERNKNRQKAYGRYQKYVPAGPVREHIQALRDSGMGLKTIGKRAGVSSGAMTKIVYGTYAKAEGPHKGRNGAGKLLRGPARRVLRETAEKIYAIDPDWGGPLELADGAILDEEASAAASGKLQALVALGWSMSELGRRLEITNVIPIIKGERRLLVATGRRIDALFDELHATLPQAETRFEQAAITRSLNFAKAHGWRALEIVTDSPDELAGGRWVQRGAVQVWEAS